nr:unnamed protein product [Callosobruchus chinensis]CAH7763294.1 unnamed protein product [Callosobruchus chinensis]
MFFNNNSYIQFISNPQELVGTRQGGESRTYYKDNEFTKTISEAGQLLWNLFNIPCPNKTLLEQLKALLSKMIAVYE